MCPVACYYPDSSSFRKNRTSHKQIMLSQEEFDQWVLHCNLSDRDKNIIDNIRSSPPARRVQSRIGNVRGHFNRSRKMNHTIQYESRTVELSAILMMEYDDDVLEIWDQPPSFVVNYKDNAGKHRGYTYTADFFVIRRNNAGWEEWKTEGQLKELAAKHPNRYLRDDNNLWHFLPGDRYAADFNLYFQVHSSAELNSVQTQNFKLLMPYFTDSDSHQDYQPKKNILSAVEREPGISMAELLGRIDGISNEDIFKLITLDQIYVDLRQAWLGNEQQTQIYRSKEAADFSHALSETTKLANEATSLIAKEKQQDPRSEKRIPTKEEMIEAMRRLEIIKPAIYGKPITDKTAAPRTHRKWIADFKEAAREDGNGLLGLIPRHRGKGNTDDRLALIDERLRPLMIDCISNLYETPVQQTKNLVYGKFALRCEELGLKPPTYRTFRLAIKNRADATQIAKMEGNKVAYQHNEFIDPSYIELPVHGDRPWECVHIDHTQLDVELRHSTKEPLMGKAWITLLIDSFSRRVLAFYLTFDSPSYRSCMSVIRECVRRFNRLPESIYSDNGAEFRSIFYEKLVAQYKCDSQWRPPTKPRFGAIIERFIHTLNKQFIHNLQGNTKIMKKARQVAKEVNPKNFAVWTLPLLESSLDTYFFEEYDTNVHSGLGCSPREEYQRGMNKFPLPQPIIAYDEDFKINTLPTTPKETAKVSRSGGISINGIRYQSSHLRKKKVIGLQVPIRYDPFNLAHAYAYIEKQWRECFAPPNIYSKLKNCTERELKIFSDEQKQLHTVHGRNFVSRAITLAKGHASREESEREQKQRLQDDELRIIAKRHEVPSNIKTSNEMLTSETKSPPPEDIGRMTEPIDLNDLVAFQRTKRRNS